MKTVHVTCCPVCSAEKSGEMVSCRDFLVSSSSFTILQCSECGFAFTQEFPVEAEIGRYYDAPEYVSHSDTQKGIVNSLYHLARKIALRSKANLIEKYALSENRTLLDIGTGTGYFLHAMCEKEWIVTGVEKSESARKYAFDKFALNIQESGYLQDISSETKDVITMWHVLEHVENLNQTMENIHRILTENGTAFIALPNKASFDAEYYKENWAAYDVPRHLWHFSPDDFQLFAEKHNFEVKTIKPMYFDPFYISMLSEKYRGTAAASFVGLLKGFNFFAKSLSDGRKCSSLVYILKKK